MTDNDFLQWIYNRMVEVHNENELYDYMHKFKGIIEKNKMTEKDKNQIVRLCKGCKHYKDYKVGEYQPTPIETVCYYDDPENLPYFVGN